MTNDCEEKVYHMEYTCANCGTMYVQQIPKGRTAKGNGGTCPYCGKCDVGDFTYRRPK